MQWGTASTFVWDIAWRTGGGIAYVDPSPSPGTSPDRLWEVSAPGATPIALFEAPHIEAAKPSRQSADLILTYRPVWGMSDRIALWSNGSIVNDNITGALANQPADWATLNCADTRFVYMTAGSGKQGVWHIFNLQTNQDTLFLKATGLRQTQYFPTC